MKILILIFLFIGIGIASVTTYLFYTQKTVVENFANNDNLFVTTNNDEISTYTDYINNLKQTQKSTNNQIEITDNELNTESYGVAVFFDVVLKNSNGIILPTKIDSINIPLVGETPLSLTDTQGNNLDFGSVQIEPKIITTNNVSIESNISYDLLFNNKLLETKTISNKGKVSENKIGFQNAISKYSFADDSINELIESATGSVYTNRLEIVLKNADIFLTTDTVEKHYKWDKPSTIYTLRVKNDQTKKTVIGSSGTYSVQNDHQLVECSYGLTGKPLPIPPTIIVKSLNGQILAMSKHPQGSDNVEAYYCSEPVSGVPTGQSVIFVIDGQNYSIQTPSDFRVYRIQCNYKEQTPLSLLTTYPPEPPPEPTYIKNCFSNFGYS